MSSRKVRVAKAVRQRRHPPDARAEAPKTSQSAPPIVGIGASAGGLEAFTQLLRALPSDTGMAFVLIQHLEARHESMLARLLSSATQMPVTEIKQRTEVRADHVYVIPPNADITFVKGVLHVLVREAPAGRHMPVDHFFRSLALDQGARAIGVILSGTASDGTIGLRAIKVEGGITFAQEPASAKFDGMPQSAIAAGCIDFVLPPEGIARELAQISRHPYVGLPQLEEALPLLSAGEEDWGRIFRLLRAASGVDFTYYKKSTIKRRVARRMALHKIEELRTYAKYLEDNREEINALYQDILIHVTEFFREPDVFRALQTTIFPQILAGHASGEPIRIWSAGCSSGEETYSLAISLLGTLGDRSAAMPIQIFGSDISEQAIDRARAGVYPANALAHVSQDRVRRFFTRGDGHFRVNSAVRDLCVFARHDLTRDPPFSRMDLISCRNVLIYLEPVLQKRVLGSLHYALKDSGFLLLGKSETLGGFPDLFSIADRKNKLFVKKALAVPVYEAGSSAYERAALPVKRREEEAQIFDLEKEADRAVWERYTHAGLVVNNDLQILHFRGDTSPYLRPAPGKATFNLLRMLREELVFELRAAIHRARKSGGSVRRESIRLKHNGSSRDINVEVQPLAAPKAREKYFLILFEEMGPPSEPAAAPPPPGRKQRKGEDREVLKLRSELARTREYLQAIIQEQEATNEELKSSNEEALSSMEELQSSNEELETAKEELQSGNEELVTLNDQVQDRNAELARLSDDLSNVLSGVSIPIVMLDSERRIRRFTPTAEKVLHLVGGDIGRPLGNIRLGLDVPDLDNLITVAMDREREVQREIRAEDGRWYSARVLPYKTSENKVAGALLTFVDVHALKQEQAATMRALMESAAQGILAVDGQGRIVLVNAAAEKMFGYTRREIIGQPVEKLIPTRFQERHRSHRERYFLEPYDRPIGLGPELAALRRDGTEFPVEIGLSHIETEGITLGVALISDISERKKNEATVVRYQQDLQALAARLLHAREEEGKRLARELHDVFSQKLAALGMEISTVVQGSPKSPKPLLDRVRLLGQQIGGLAEDIHQMSRQLHPAILDDLGLEAALRDECANFSRQHGISAEFKAQSVPNSLTENASLCLYRVAQESLRNIAKHAHAKKVEVRLAGEKGTITLRIQDAGDGFDPEQIKGKGGLGLISMEERVRLANGKFTIRSQPGQGTTVEARLPVGGKVA